MSDYETIQRRRNIVVGVFVILALVALGWLVFKFRDLPAFIAKRVSFKVYIQFPTAPGIQQDTPVRFCGYQIGRVTNVMAPDILEDLKTGLKYHQTKVVIMIDKNLANIPSNVEVRLMSRGLGSSYIELKVDPTAPLVPQEPNHPETQYLCDGIILQGSTGMTSEFFPEESQKKFEQLVESFNSLVRNANDIIGDATTKDNLKTILDNLSKATEQAIGALEEFRRMSSAGADTLENADAGIDKLVEAMVETSEQLSKTSSELHLVLQKVSDGSGSAAQLLNNGRLYENLLENTEQLRLLLEDVRSLMQKVDEKGLRSVY